MRFEGAVVFSADDGRCRAEATVTALQRRAVAHGAELHVRTAVERIDVGPGGAGARATVHSTAGSWRAPAVVVAAGAWAHGLLGGIVDGLPPLQVTLEQPAHFRPVLADVGWPSFLHHAPGPGPGHPLGFGAYGVFSPGEGMKVGEHGTGPTIDPDRSPRTVDPGPLARLGRYVATWLPGLDPEPVAASTCLYTTTPDQHFVLDRRGPVVVCSPCSGHGFKFVPAIGEIVADLADGGSQDDVAWRLAP
jgi:sarcosine oxidase